MTRRSRSIHHTAFETQRLRLPDNSPINDAAPAFMLPGQFWYGYPLDGSPNYVHGPGTLEWELRQAQHQYDCNPYSKLIYSKRK